MVRRTHGTGETKADVERETPTMGDVRAALGSNSGADAILLGFVERFERLTEEIGGLTADRKEVMDEAKSSGFDTKTLRNAIRRRAMDAATRQEQDALLELYEEALKAASAKQVETSRSEGT